MGMELHEAELIKWLRRNQWLVENGFIPKAHAVFADPPYFLGETVKRFGKSDSAPAKYGRDGAFQRQSRGFMGQTWDGFEDIWQFQAWVTEWARLMLSYVYPGALLVMAGGTRTYHRLTAGLEDAGWEIEDCVFCWTYGCVDEETEILTDNGWMPYHKSIENYRVLCYNKDTQGFTWEHPTHVYRYDYDDTAYRIVSDSTDQLVSRNHRCLVEREGTLVFEFAEETARERQARVPVLENLRGLLRALHSTQSDAKKAVRASRFTRTDLARIEPVHYQGVMWCPTVPTGAFVARRNGKVFITGNSGFPKSLNVGKAIDKAQRRNYVQAAIDLGMPLPENSKWDWTKGEHSPSDQWWDVFKRYLSEEQWGAIERAVTGSNNRAAGWFASRDGHTITAPATPEGAKWNGHGTALKPSVEPYVIARAPRMGYTYANLALEFGSGAFNIDGGRIGTEQTTTTIKDFSQAHGNQFGKPGITYPSMGEKLNPPGRFPANTLFACECTGEHAPDCPVRVMDEQSGELRNGGQNLTSGDRVGMFGVRKPQIGGTRYAGDSGGASRFFYQAKASSAEREWGLDDFTPRNVNDGRDTPIDNPYQRGETLRKNTHPTVKPIRLCEYLARLILPPELTIPRRILIPFAGSGSEMIGAHLAGWDEIIGIEMTAEYAAINRARTAWWQQFKSYEEAEKAVRGKARKPKARPRE